MSVASGATHLRALLSAAHVPVGRGKKPSAASFLVAWTAFQRFARLAVDRDDLSGDEPNDDLLYEFGVYESTYWGTSFEVDFTRQFATANGDIQQVHLVVHFPVTAFVPIAGDLRATPCVPGSGCVFGCFFTDDDALVPKTCRLVPKGGYRVKDMTLWASESGGEGAEAQRADWARAIESSPVFRALISRRIPPVGYEIWQDSAE
jgi:hypothetical protein